MSSSIFIPGQTLHFWCRKTTCQTWSQLVRLDLPLCSQPARPRGLWRFLFALHKQLRHMFKIPECYLTPGGRLNSSKTKGALFIGEETQGKWGRLCYWILEPTKEASPEKLDYRLVLQWGDQRSPLSSTPSPSSDRSYFQSEMFLPTDSVLVSLPCPSLLGSRPVLWNITKLILNKTFYGCLRMATEQQGFLVFVFIFVFFQARATLCSLECGVFP